MSQQNEAIFRRWIERVWEAGDESVIDELFDKNAAATFPNFRQSKPIHGVEEYKRFVRFIRSCYEGIEIKIEQIASDDDKVVSFCTFSGTPKGIGDGSRRAVSGLAQIMIREGRIVQTWSNIELFEAAEADPSAGAATPEPHLQMD